MAVVGDDGNVVWPYLLADDYDAARVFSPSFRKNVLLLRPSRRHVRFLELFFFSFMLRYEVQKRFSYHVDQK